MDDGQDRNASDRDTPVREPPGRDASFAAGTRAPPRNDAARPAQQRASPNVDPSALPHAAVLCRDCLTLTTKAELWGGDATPANTATPYPDLCPDCHSERLIAHDELTALTIAHIDCDAFYASVEKRDDPSLQDKPLIVGHDGGRGVVTTACYVARRYGVRSAMPMFQAMRACPHAVVIRPAMAKYKAVSQHLRALFREVTDIIEPVSLDEAYLDCTGVDADPRQDAILKDGVAAATPTIACTADGEPVVRALARTAQRIEQEIGITVSIGLSSNKFLAKLASDLQKPRGFSVIGPNEAAAFLAPLPVRKINGVGEATARRMEAAGIATIGDLQRLTRDELIARFGRFGRRLADYARGEDHRSVSTARGSKSVSAETTFAVNRATAAELKEALAPLCERVASRLQVSGYAGRNIVLKLKTADFKILTRNLQLPSPTQRAAQLFASGAHLIDREADGRMFRLIGIGVSDLGPATSADPPDLFDNTPLT